ncbi:MAG: ABC transporter permease [Myxococcota bacterium]|nr:ABC transporter permease [Myxococcota bacterium]
MKLATTFKLAVSDLRMKPQALLSSVVGIALAVAFLGSVLSLSLGIRETIGKKWVGEYPLDRVEVVKPSLKLGLFEFDGSSLFGERKLDRALLGRLRDIDVVDGVYPVLSINLPLGARGGRELLGKSLYADVMVTGVPAELLAGELQAYLTQDSSELMPVLVSDKLVDMFNSAVAPVVGIPRVQPEALRDIEFEILVGRSLMMGSRGAKKQGVIRSKVVGASPYAVDLGVTVSIGRARSLIKEYASSESAEERYQSIWVKLKHPDFLPDFVEEVAAMGYEVHRRGETLEQVWRVVFLFALLLGSLVFVLAALIMGHVISSYVRERWHELAIMRAVGAPNFSLLQLVCVEALVLGFLGWAFGMMVLGGLAVGVESGLAQFIPPFPLKPEVFFVMPAWLACLLFIASVLAAMCGALPSLLRVSRANISTMLRRGS